MKTLKVDKVGWKKLQGILDILIKAINRSTPTKGYGITVSETENGVIISIDPKSDDFAQAIEQILTGWLTFVWTGVNWQDVTVVDPSSCEQSTIKVLTKVDGQKIELPVYFNFSNIQLNPTTDPTKYSIGILLVTS